MRNSVATILKRVQDNDPYESIKNASLEITLGYIQFNNATELSKCLQDKTVFGLSNGESFIVFDPERNRIYDYTCGALNVIDSKNEKDFINYVKLSLITHRQFYEGQKCIDYFKAHKLLT